MLNHSVTLFGPATEQQLIVSAVLLVFNFVAESVLLRAQRKREVRRPAPVIRIARIPRPSCVCDVGFIDRMDEYSRAIYAGQSRLYRDR